MADIIIGTTPTIKYRFKEVDVSNIVTAFLTVKKDHGTMLRKPLSEAEVGENSLSWTFSQAETLEIGTGTARIMLNWVLMDGTRGASHESEIRLKGNHIAEVI